MTAIKKTFLEKPWWLQILTIAAVMIVYINITGLLGAKLLPLLIDWGDGISEGVGDHADKLPGLFVRWDSGYYLTIAQQGYWPDGNERGFFPLYPVLTGIISRTLRIPILWTGLLVSVLSFIGAGLFMYQWVRIDYKPEMALWATIFMYIFPMAFFFVAFYAEPLLLLTSIASLYFARRGQFIASGIAIALAGATRGPAFLLAIPYALEFWQQHSFTRNRWLQFMVGALIAPIGFIAFLTFIRGTHVEGGWETYYTWPWIVFFDGLKAAIFGVGITPDWFARFLVWQDLLYAVAALVISIWALKRLRLSAVAYLLIGTLFFWTVHGPYDFAFWSIPRRIATLFPIYLALVLFVNHLPARYRWIPIGGSIFLLGILSAWFASGRWVA